MRVEASTIARTAVLFVSMINMFLQMTGHSALPFSEEWVGNVVSAAFMAAASLWAWWKNNSFTKAAIKADAVMKAEKQKEA